MKKKRLREKLAWCREEIDVLNRRLQEERNMTEINFVCKETFDKCRKRMDELGMENQALRKKYEGAGSEEKI